MKTKILITGSRGFLGSRLAYYFKDKYELLLPTHDALNVSHEEAVKAYMEEHQPDVVIHCAALSNTSYCEQHREESHKVNVQGTVRIAKACKLTPRVAVKCDPAIAIELRERYRGIEPAYHMNKRMWNDLYMNRDLEDEEVKKRIKHSYDEVIRNCRCRQGLNISNLFFDF